jgi:hypothetical protein
MPFKTPTVPQVDPAEFRTRPRQLREAPGWRKAMS